MKTQGHLQHTVSANNFAQASENRMHSDEVAAQFGFRGGLVPGVGVYAYMTVPAVESWGREWLKRGTMWGKFLKPVYHGEEVNVTARTTAPNTLETEVLNREGTVCAVGKATLPETPPAPPDPAQYPPTEPPPREARRAPAVEALPVGLNLGAISFEALGGNLRGESGNLFVDDVCNALDIFRGPEAPVHPAIIPARANSILMANVALGPWIHTQTAARHFAVAAPHEQISVRARVDESYAKRGHVFTVLDVAFFGDHGRTLAHCLHTAIINPAPAP